MAGGCLEGKERKKSAPRTTSRTDEGSTNASMVNSKVGSRWSMAGRRCSRTQLGRFSGAPLALVRTNSEFGFAMRQRARKQRKRRIRPFAS